MSSAARCHQLVRRNIDSFTAILALLISLLIQASRGFIAASFDLLFFGDLGEIGWVKAGTTCTRLTGRAAECRYPHFSPQHWAANVARNAEDLVAVIIKLTLVETVDLQRTQKVV